MINIFSSEEESFNTLLNENETCFNHQTKIGKDLNSIITPFTPFIFTISDYNNPKESYFKFKNNELSDFFSLKKNNKMNIDEEEKAIDKFENKIQNNYFFYKIGIVFNEIESTPSRQNLKLSRDFCMVFK